jgi:hypothetical protein
MQDKLHIRNADGIKEKWMDQSADTKTPQTPQPPPEFIFRGNVVAASGYLTIQRGAPVAWDLEKVTVHGESSLPTIGGISHSLVDQPALRFPDFIQYGQCSTIAEGTGDDKLKVTKLHAAVLNARATTSPSPSDAVPNLRSISFQASRLAISTQSTHPTVGQPYFQLLDPPDTSGMSLLLTPIKGSPTVVPLRLVYDPMFLSPCSMNDLDARFMGDRQFFDDHAPGMQSAAPLVFGKSKFPRTPHGYVLSSFVTRIFRGDQEIRGNVLVERGLGTIIFGTVIMEDNSRRVNLVRLELGSDPKGRASFCGADSNGIWN